MNRSLSLLSRQCSARKYTRIAALRELLDGALYLYGNLFGAHNEIDSLVDVKSKNSIETSLMKLNQSQNNAPSTVRSILHAGIIGSGLKTPAKEPSDPVPEARDMLLKAITACCRNKVGLIKFVEFIFEAKLYN